MIWKFYVSEYISSIYLVPVNYFSQLISQFFQAKRKTYKYEILLFFKKHFHIYTAFSPFIQISTMNSSTIYS